MIQNLIKHNLERLKSLNIEDYKIGDNIIFCPNCSFQLERNSY